jgi:hypothetical protein
MASSLSGVSKGMGMGIGSLSRGINEEIALMLLLSLVDTPLVGTTTPESASDDPVPDILTLLKSS